MFAVPFLTLYVENDYFFPFITGKNFGFRIIIDFVFAAWIILALYEAKYRPRISGIVWSFGILLVVMFFANLLGVHPRSSFWSNFERMDGYVSLVHTFMYMLVLGSMLQTKELWDKLLKTTLAVAFAVAFYGLAQYGGVVDGSGRIDSRLGNAAYMAVYMLFHIFIAFWLFVETKSSNLKVLYGFLILMFTFVLIETGTRGTAIGLLVGVTVMTSYIGLFGQQFKEYRKYAIGAAILLVLGAGAFVAGRDTAIVQNNPNLARIANISIDDLEIRGIIWGMAWEGVKERPLLGYGQSNFNYVFNENFDPRLYAQEQWFDRAHNIFMDWLVTGGFLGLIAYLSIFGWCLYYLLVRPFLDEDDKSFNVMERGVLLGILAGYFTHNFVVFDNIVSYIFFAIILALITSRVGKVPKALSSLKVDKMIVNQVVAPLVIVVLVASVYFFHLPGMATSSEIINAFREPDHSLARLEAFQRAIDKNSFAHQEVTEQIVQQTINTVRNPEVPDNIKNQYTSLAEQQMQRLLKEKPGDARTHVFVGSYYRATNQLDEAAKQMAEARGLSPQKQSIIIQQGFIALSKGENDEAVNLFEEAFKLDERNLEAREYYAISLLYNDEVDKVRELMEYEGAKERFANSDFFVSAANQEGQVDLVTELFEYRVRGESNQVQDWQSRSQDWATLSFLYYQAGDSEKSVEVLNEAKEAIPEFTDAADCFIKNIEAGNDPQEGC